MGSTTLYHLALAKLQGDVCPRSIHTLLGKLERLPREVEKKDVKICALNDSLAKYSNNSEKHQYLREVGR